ncbi:MAG: asparagine synthase (glutamine-hydrolyzing) [Planctomycetes bacterium]|nr:asparagine synthase (glutamine-hydrolyzing) [Planctomycetota bacterium]
MCGILGQVTRDPRFIADADRLAAARDTLTHRGPDEAGLWIRPGVALAHRRLKVLDLTHGQQPITDPQSHAAMVYNGEVYNFLDLQRHYRDSAGLTFDTRCDTELVFKALNHEGEAALPRFNGMFALAHWDDRRRSLLLVRDRLGKKPLYWYADGERLVFASELKAILRWLDRKFEVDPTALDEFFTRGYVLSPRTIFRGIHKLPAGCTLKLDAHPDRWNWAVEPWWEFQPRETPVEPGAVLDELDALLTDAVRMRLISDVPIGCLLSGGIDSSLVTALAAKVSSGPVSAFSIGFDGDDAFNELPYAKMVAERHGCRWFHKSVAAGDFMSMLDEAAPFYDEPFGNFTMFSMRRLATLAREQLVVVLTGQGGDEISAGYPGRYNWVADSEAMARDRGQASRFAPAVDDMVNHLRTSSFLPWKQGREAILGRGLLDAIDRAAGPADGLLPFWNRYPSLGRLNNVLHADTRTNLPDYLIVLEERMTMSRSLEARNPLLDYRVVEFMLSLPARFKITDGPQRRNKWALHELARRYVPAEAIDRPKRGFTPPLNLWITGNAAAIAERFRESAGMTRGVFSPAWEKYLGEGRYDNNTVMPLFYSLMLTAWAKEYGRYIAGWPTDSSSFQAPRTTHDAPSFNSPRARAALRQQDTTAISESRWFCQVLANLPAGAPVRVVGEEREWFEFLAKGSGHPAAAGGDAAALMIVGTEAAEVFASGTADVSPPHAILLFIPFAQSAITETQALLRRVAARAQLAGSQAIPISADRAVLVARGTCGTLAAAPSAA